MVISLTVNNVIPSGGSKTKYCEPKDEDYCFACNKKTRELFINEAPQKNSVENDPMIELHLE